MNPAFALLLPFLQGSSAPAGSNDENPARCLLVADENLHDVDFSSIDKATEVISNRFDIAQRASAAGLSTQFNDFDFSAYPPGHFTGICYRVSKERAVVEHIIDHALALLSDGGELILCGAKNEGLKRYGSVAAKRFDSSVLTRKHGAMYLARITRPPGHSTDIVPTTSDSGTAYNELIPVRVDGDLTLYTKAGAFGSAKIDQGSQMLAAYLSTFFHDFAKPPHNLLDLGCGYGYLSACAARFELTRIVATDNCAAAIDTCRANMTRLSLPVEVIADDCAEGIKEKFDAIICNPPFHQGFKTDSALSEKFVEATAKHLKPGGRALFVVNQFVPLEKLAVRIFSDMNVDVVVDLVERNQSFKLIRLIRR